MSGRHNGVHKVLVGEVNMGSGDGDGDEKEWVCDSGADFHMTGDKSLFDIIGPIPSTFFVKQHLSMPLFLFLLLTLTISGITPGELLPHLAS